MSNEEPLKKRRLVARAAVETVQDLAKGYTGHPNWEYPVRWYQFWRYHRYLTSNYRECRLQDRLTEDRIQYYMKQELAVIFRPEGGDDISKIDDPEEKS
tara:strand:- start:279 stop:575 length:297 start_codon:yes stop_codon:yes gene_type:complete